MFGVACFTLVFIISSNQGYTFNTFWDHVTTFKSEMCLNHQYLFFTNLNIFHVLLMDIFILINMDLDQDRLYSTSELNMPWFEMLLRQSNKSTAFEVMQSRFSIDAIFSFCKCIDAGLIQWRIWQMGVSPETNLQCVTSLKCKFRRIRFQLL